MLKRNMLILLLIFGLSILSFSQSQQKIDSLVQLTYTAPKDTNLVNTYEKITRLYLRIQLDSMRVYAQKMIDLSEQLNYNKGLAMGNYLIGTAYNYQREFEKALVYFNSSGKIFKKNGDTINWINIKATIANVFSMTNKYDTAVMIFNNVIKYHKKNNDFVSMAKVMVNLARIYSDKGDFSRALSMLYSAKLAFQNADNYSWLASTERSLAVVYAQIQQFDSAISINNRVKIYYQSINDNFRLGEIYSNIGALFEIKNDSKKALEAYHYSLRYREKAGDIGGIAITRMNIGDLYLSMGVFDSVLMYLNSSGRVFKESKELYALASNMLLTGTYYNKTKQFQKAVKYYLKGYKISADNKLKEKKKDAAKLLSEVYEELHDYKNALKYAKLYKVQYDSLINEKEIKEQTIAEEGYKYKLQLLKKEQEIDKERQQKNYMILIGSVVIFFLILLVVYHRKLQKSKLLQIEQQNRVKIQEASLKTQREERKRVANILHDNLAHLIQNSQQNLNNTIAGIKEEKPRQKLLQIEDNLVFMNKLAKVASYELEFSFVLEKNLVDQFVSYIGRIEHSHTPKIYFNYSNKDDFDLLTDEIKINVFSVFQEMLGNAVKYANAKSITVSLYYDNEKTTLQVTDDGIGFNYDEVRHGQGFENMKVRAEKLNGSFSFESEPGFGTKLKFEV